MCTCTHTRVQDKLLIGHEGRAKELETAKTKLQATLQSNSAQMEKHRQSAEEFKHKCWGLEGQLTAVRKVRRGEGGERGEDRVVFCRSLMP